MIGLFVLFVQYNSLFLSKFSFPSCVLLCLLAKLEVSI